MGKNFFDGVLVRPKLTLQILNPIGTMTPLTNGGLSLYYHFIVKNLREWVPARNVKICCIAYEIFTSKGSIEKFLLPISFKGRMVQYAGRLHRQSPGKKNVIIYDYLDTCSGLTVSMYRKRVHAYRQMGYQIHAPEHSLIANRGIQPSLFK